MRFISTPPVSAEPEAASARTAPVISAFARLRSQHVAYGSSGHRVFGARLRITALRPASGPGIELLQYLSPRGGRPMPSDARANDLFHWQIVVSASDSRAVSSAATMTGGRSISPVAQAREAFVRDRDGHALRVHDSRCN